MTSVTAQNPRAWSAVTLAARWEMTRRKIDAGQQLKMADGRILWVLRDGEPRTLRQLADELGLEQSTINRQVNAALDAGLVERSRASDSGTYLVTSTDRGRTLLHDDVERHLVRYGHALAAIPTRDQELFLDHLASFLEALESTTDAPSP